MLYFTGVQAVDEIGHVCGTAAMFSISEPLASMVHLHVPLHAVVKFTRAQHDAMPHPATLGWLSTLHIQTHQKELRPGMRWGLTEERPGTGCSVKPCWPAMRCRVAATSAAEAAGMGCAFTWEWLPPDFRNCMYLSKQNSSLPCQHSQPSAGQHGSAVACSVRLSRLDR